jgi:hypothetical protein
LLLIFLTDQADPNNIDIDAINADNGDLPDYLNDHTEASK